MRRISKGKARAKTKGLRLAGGTDSKKPRTRRPPNTKATNDAPPHRQGTRQNPLYTAEEIARQSDITKALALSDAGLSVREIAEQLGRSVSTAHGYLKAGFAEARSLELRHEYIERRVRRNMRIVRAYWLAAVGYTTIDPKTRQQVQIAPDPEAAKVVMAADDRIASTLALDHKAVDMVKLGMPTRKRAFEDWTDEEIARWRETREVPPGKEPPRRYG